MDTFRESVLFFGFASLRDAVIMCAKFCATTYLFPGPGGEECCLLECSEN